MARLPRALHPLAWWAWAIGCAVAAGTTTNPLWLCGLAGALTWVVLERRTDAPWAQAYRYYLWGALLIVAFRVFFRILLGGGLGSHVLLPLPEIPLPDLAAGITLLGDLTLESLLAGVYDGLRLAVMLLCLGAANALANPRRLLRAMPPALHEVSTAVIVALSVFPQLADSFVRVRNARRLRPATVTGTGRRARLRSLRSVVVPVLEDAFDRSLELAASMDARGYGRTGGRTRSQQLMSGGCMLLGIGGLCVGSYGLLDQEHVATTLTVMLLVGGTTAAVAGIVLSGRGVVRTTYRPDPWRWEEFATIVSGAAAAWVMIEASQHEWRAVSPSPYTLDWPVFSVLTLLALLLCLAPVVVAPRPPLADGGVR